VAEEPTEWSGDYPVGRRVYTGTTRSTDFTERIVANGGGSDIIESTVPGANRAGWFRITRTGSTLKVYEYDGVSSSWRWNGNTSGFTVSNFSSSENLRPMLWTKQESNARLKGQYLDFEIVSADSLVYSPL
jgi:hypothetical protein